jgi:hypothetical protein
MGKGLGNRFLDDLRHADALVHVVDVSGTTDAEGMLIPPRSRGGIVEEGTGVGLLWGLIMDRQGYTRLRP